MTASVNTTIQEINENLSKNNLPKIDKKARFNPCYKGYKGALGYVNGYFARMHKLNGGTIINTSQKDIAAEANEYSIKTIRRAISKLEKAGRLIVFRAWKNSYLYLPENVGILSWLENFKAKTGIDLKTQTRVETVKNDNQSMGQNVPKKGTKCPQDDLSYIESFKELEKPPVEIEPDPPPDQPEESELDCIKNAMPQKFNYLIKDVDERIEKSIEENDFEYTLWAAKEAHGNKSTGYFIDMLNNKWKYDKYEKQRTRKCEAAEKQKQTERKNDTNLMIKAVDSINRQSLTPSTSDEKKPSNPNKGMALQGGIGETIGNLMKNTVKHSQKKPEKEVVSLEESIFLFGKYAGELWKSRYACMTIEQIVENKEYQTFINRYYEIG